MNRTIVLAFFLGMTTILVGCKYKHPHITAVSLDPCTFGKETGVPFYLPKPLLIVAKNFRNIEETKVGLTDSPPIPTAFDDQAKYADLNARTNFNGLNSGGAETGTNSGNPVAATSTSQKSAPQIYSPQGAPVTPFDAPSDGLAPDTFFTYQIVFVPDLTQKYGLKIQGGPGEIRAAMNLVNGWQFTGLGPYYMKDSSRAQNILAFGIAGRLFGQGAADIIDSVADLSGALQTAPDGTVSANNVAVQSLAKSIQELPVGCRPMSLANYAEIHVFEPHVGPDGVTQWTPIVDLTFNREYLGMKTVEAKFAQPASTPVSNGGQGAATGIQSGAENGAASGDRQLMRAVVAQALGIPQDSQALAVGGSRTQSEGENGSPTGGSVNQIQVDCGKGCKCSRCCPKERGKRRKTIQNRSVRGLGALFGGQKPPGGLLPGGLIPPSAGSGIGEGAAREIEGVRRNLSNESVVNPVRPAIPQGQIVPAPQGMGDPAPLPPPNTNGAAPILKDRWLAPVVQAGY